MSSSLDGMIISDLHSLVASRKTSGHWEHMATLTNLGPKVSFANPFFSLPPMKIMSFSPLGAHFTPTQAWSCYSFSCLGIDSEDSKLLVG